jgi:nucleotide sugar dehydrogenase
MKIGVIGAGYVGLTTAICLASMKHEISIFDIDNEKTKCINRKKIPFFEPGLEELLDVNISKKNLHVTNDLNVLVQNTEGCFICVGTPTKNNSIDLSQIKSAIESLVDSIKNSEKRNYAIIIRSTIIPNTTREVLLPIITKKLKEQQCQLFVVPEFLREGNALDDFMNPDKIVIGSVQNKKNTFVDDVFKNFKGKCDFIHTNLESAELIKYTNNSFFSMLISFSNEIANISEKIPNVDPFQVLQALISDKRITTITNNKKIIPELNSYLIPGCGFGGSCFPKDVKAIQNFADLKNIDTPILNAILAINDERPKKMVSLCEKILGGLKTKKITVLGLTFKPDTDDIRSSPSLDAINLFLDKGSIVSAYDPMFKNQAKTSILPNDCNYCMTIQEALSDSDAALVFTKWPEFKSLDSKFLKQYMKNPVVIDGRGFLDKEKFDDEMYFKIGYSE